MPEEIKTPPVGQETGKKPEEVIAELKADKEKLEKQVKDKDEFIGRQSTEIGDLRKKSQTETKPETQEDKDELIEELTRELKADGYTEENARDTAKTLAKSGLRIVSKQLNERMMVEVVDLVEEAMEEKKIDEAIYKENEKDILDEFKARKLAPTARKNYKILRDCYDIVTRRKADTLRSQKEKEATEKRDKEIAGVAQPPSGGKPPSEEDKKETDAIRSAGSKRSSAFF